ncbi:hypothetical protein CALCODRAFT_497932 [Calocera cornea HHB12733]|uniref:Uncharacterized protein n=1 Tax=Calocera cornea HHB12733 TaxID=1353952 RepID=A0A165F1T0_9BASI|nr:hypothetical protein CALCODRAFT_497932 [Calocera cornea HHB12733]
MLNGPIDRWTGSACMAYGGAISTVTYAHNNAILILLSITAGRNAFPESSSNAEPASDEITVPRIQRCASLPFDREVAITQEQ